MNPNSIVAIAVTGAAGRMGKSVVRLVAAADDMELSGATEEEGHPAVGKDAGEVAGAGRLGVTIVDDAARAMKGARVVVDFTTPGASVAHARVCRELGVPLVIGTTGFSEEERRLIVEQTSEIPILLSPNMSAGVNLIFRVAAEMAKALGEDYDLEVVEAHHRAKRDAPSGTALEIAEALARATGRDLEEHGVYSRVGKSEGRRRGDIAVLALRGGDVVGDHTVHFLGRGERLELTHRAQSRGTFARGALRAARWLVDQSPGLYDMQDVLGLK